MTLAADSDLVMPHTSPTSPEAEARHLRELQAAAADPTGPAVLELGGGAGVGELPRRAFVREAALRIVSARAARDGAIDVLTVEAAIEVAAFLYDQTQGD